jgi:hypothetical protein
MRKSALALCIVATGFMFSAKAVELTDADWLSAAKIALKEFKRSETVTYVVDDGLSPQARNALENLRKVVSLGDVPGLASSGAGNYWRVLQFRPQGDRIEFLAGSVYPLAYQPDDCRVTTHLFLARKADGEWQQDGPVKLQICSHH